MAVKKASTVSTNSRIDPDHRWGASICFRRSQLRSTGFPGEQDVGKSHKGIRGGAPHQAVTAWAVWRLT
jgi:hypothetical protein